jgi:polyhydroxyalkanoate synthesis repressor PhaR
MRIIKKYPNRRLYDTETSAYITLSDVKELVLSQVEFQVLDAKTNLDITRTILMQIILEEETGAVPLFSSHMLAQMIRCYGNAMQGVMGTYLEKGIQSFLEVQRNFQDQATAMYGKAPRINTEAWAQFLKAQGPVIQGLMGTYLEQSTKMFMQMQKEMQKQARSIFGVFPFVPASNPTDEGEPPGTEGRPAGDKRNRSTSG